LHVAVVGNFTKSLLEARAKFPYDVLDLFLCPAPQCHYSWRMQFTQMYRHSACVDLIPHGRTQFIVDVDHQCRYWMRNETFETTCDEFMTLPVIDILGFDHCWSASPRKVFTEECSNICKHGRPVSRCVYTVDPDGDFALEDTLDGCYLTGLCMCRTSDMSVCDLEARFIECYRTDEAIERLETEAELKKLHQSLGANASMTQKYDVLEAAYDQRKSELNELEEENEEVSDQLSVALAQLQEQRNAHKAEVGTRSRVGDAQTDGVIGADKLDDVNQQLAAEIRARKKKEMELQEAKKKNTRLRMLLATAFVAILGALGSAFYFMKRRPSVLMLNVAGEGEATDSTGTAVRNSTVVMGREVAPADAKASATDIA
jgi:hypothetical protein